MSDAFDAALREYDEETERIKGRLQQRTAGEENTMSRELRHVEVTVTVLDYDHLPEKDGQQMYADDVVQEIRDVLTAALTDWYQQRGHDLLACEPYL